MSCLVLWLLGTILMSVILVVRRVLTILPIACRCGINYIVGLIGLISFLFNVGPIDNSLYDYGGQPWVAVIYRITGSKAATIVLIIVVAINVKQTIPNNNALLLLTKIAVLLLANELRYDVLKAAVGLCKRQGYT